MADEIVSIHQAITEAKRRIGHIGKEDRNKDQGYEFRGIDSILNKAGPIAADLGIVVYPRTRVVSSEPVESRQGTRGYRVVVESVWTFAVHVDREQVEGVRFPDYSSLEAVTLGEAIDYSDKGFNKAQRQSEKNAWQQVLSIPTGEPDPDHESPTQAAAGAPLSTAQLVLELLQSQGLDEEDAKAYARQAVEDLSLAHPIPADEVMAVGSRALELWDARQEEPGY